LCVNGSKRQHPASLLKNYWINDERKATNGYYGKMIFNAVFLREFQCFCACAGVMYWPGHSSGKTGIHQKNYGTGRFLFSVARQMLSFC